MPDVEELAERLTRVEERLAALVKEVRHHNEVLDELKQQVSAIAGSQNAVEMILKYVVTPLLIIVGALVGVKITGVGAAVEVVTCLTCL